MAAITNHLIDLIPHSGRTRVLGLCERVELNLSEVLADSAAVTRHVYFPTGCFLSSFKSFEDFPVLEIGMVSSEGMLGSQVALDVPQSGLHARVQGKALLGDLQLRNSRRNSAATSDCGTASTDIFR
jgi:hypothetical protein